MTDRLTDKEIEEIRERAEAATEEPWVKWVSGPEVFSGVTKNEPGSISHEEQICTLDDFMRDASQVDDDARFIAHARTDIPRLLDEVERLREERDRYREALTAIHEMSELDHEDPRGTMACDMQTIAENALEGTDE